MKRFSTICLFLFLLTHISSAITNVTLNNKNYVIVSALPQTLTLDFDIQSPKAKVEIYQDFNSNQIVDRTDKRIKVYNIIDGIQTITDQQTPWNYIPGDDDPQVGKIRTPLKFDAENAPKSNDRWIIKISDEDNSAASAFVDWQLPVGRTCILGVVKDEATFAGLPNVLVKIEPEDSDQEYFAVTDHMGNFRMNVTEGAFQVSTVHFDQKYYSEMPSSVYVNHNQKCHLNIECSKFDTYYSSVITYADGTPAKNVGILLENAFNFKIFTGVTDKNGLVQIGVQPGTYIIHAKPYYAKKFTNGNWPEGFYANIQKDSIKLVGGARMHNAIELQPYPIKLSGRCFRDGKPAKNILVQAVSESSDPNKQKLYQTFSDADGNYVLGTFQHETCSVYAQVEAATCKPKKGYRKIKIANKKAVNHLNFEIISDEAIMSMHGCIKKDDNISAENMTVIAYNPWANSDECQLYTQTDADGNYHFSVTTAGDWQISVHSQDYSIIPEMHYIYLNRGSSFDNLDFVLTDKDAPAILADGRQFFSELTILSRLENPFNNSTLLEFITPETGMATVSIQTTDGKEIKQMYQDILPEGIQHFYWDGTDEDGQSIADGIYQYRITLNAQQVTSTFTLIR